MNRRIRYYPDQTRSGLRESPSFPRKRESISASESRNLRNKAALRIDHFNGAATRETEILDTLPGVEPIVIEGIILAEGLPRLP